MGGSSKPNFSVKLASAPDPLPAYKFWIEIESIVVAEFEECSGIRLERDFDKVEEGGVNDHVHILPGRNKYSNIVLKRGMMLGNELWSWYQEGLYDTKVKRVNFSILLRDVAGEVAKRWNVINGFPLKWEVNQLTSDSNKYAIETLEIAHDGITLGQ